jgi:hypothetical protein
MRIRGGTRGVSSRATMAEHDDLSIASTAQEAIDSGQALIIYNMDFELTGRGKHPAIDEHEDGSVEIRIRLVPGSAKRVFVLGSRLYGRVHGG